MRSASGYSKIPGTTISSGAAQAGHGSGSSMLASVAPSRGPAPAPTRATPGTISRWSWLNMFQYCKFLRFVGHVMVLMVLGLLSFTFYVLVVQVYGPRLFSRSVGRVLTASVAVTAFCIEAVMILWAYFACVSTDPGRVPPGWHPFSDEHQALSELERMSYSDYYFDRRDPRRPRFCKRCQAWKPERSHHCSVSGRCILRMDHYCIWVVNCIGLLNYKAFLLFLLYTFVGCVTAVALLLKPMIDFFSQGGAQGAPLAFLVVFVDGMLGLCVGGFLVMHLQLIASNCTTIEMYEKDRLHPWPYNRGLRRNFEDTFGRNKLRWLLPMYTKEEKRVLTESCLSQRLLSTPFASAAV